MNSLLIIKYIIVIWKNGKQNLMKLSESEVIMHTIHLRTEINIAIPLIIEFDIKILKKNNTDIVGIRQSKCV